MVGFKSYKTALLAALLGSMKLQFASLDFRFSDLNCTDRVLGSITWLHLCNLKSPENEWRFLTGPCSCLDFWLSGPAPAPGPASIADWLVPAPFQIADWLVPPPASARKLYNHLFNPGSFPANFA